MLLPENTNILDRLGDVLKRARLPLESEKATQAALAEAFDQYGIPYVREVTLSEGDIVDFLVEGIAIEIKLKGSRMAIYRQICRYAASPKVHRVLLLTARCMGLPEEIEGKPANVFSLSEAWL